MTAIDVVIPVLNEEKALVPSVARLRAFLGEHLPWQWRIVIADNGSTDGTLALAQALSREHPTVSCIRLEERGRGRALRRAWLESDADILSYMDVDLSTGLEAYPPLIRAIAEEGYDLAVGSRLLPGSRLRRSLKRDVLSRSYNFLIKAMFFTPFSDAQCGFKAISRKAAQDLLPLTRDTGWFFDTELLIIAVKRGYRIRDIPVSWTEDPDSRVKIGSTVYRDIQGLLRLRFQRPWRR
ncbi:MAG: glycosyltransferase [Chloroflexi bacterium]|nr:glycosyltransferase [Chloroflexota bacterium]